MGISETLAELMQRTLVNGKPISQGRLAAVTGLRQPTIARILKGRQRDVKSATIDPLCAFFNVSAAQLRGEEPINWAAYQRIGEPSGAYTAERIPAVKLPRSVQHPPIGDIAREIASTVECLTTEQALDILREVRRVAAHNEAIYQAILRHKNQAND